MSYPPGMSNSDYEHVNGANFTDEPLCARCESDLDLYRVEINGEEMMICGDCVSQEFTQALGRNVVEISNGCWVLEPEVENK